MREQKVPQQEEEMPMANQVKCPNCMNRLFDVKKEATVEIEIKCPKCKKVVDVKLKTA